MMRAILPAIFLLAACGQGAAPAPVPGSDPAHPADASAPAAPPAAKLDTASVTGSWSFDRTCASEDAMGLMPDGKVYYDEWGEGTWAIDPDGRLVFAGRVGSGISVPRATWFARSSSATSPESLKRVWIAPSVFLAPVLRTSRET